MKGVTESRAPRRHAWVVIAGNPNSGKTALFNALTGSFQKVGNYPGVTVEKVVGRAQLGDLTVDLIDAPGLYAFEALSEDERIALDLIHGRNAEPKPDLYLYVLDALHLERNLFLFSHFVESQFPTVIALTMTDVLQKEGKSIHASRLSEILGVDVVPVISHKDVGIEELKEAIRNNIIHPKVPKGNLAEVFLEAKVEAVSAALFRVGVDYSREQIREALLGHPNDLEARISTTPSAYEVFLSAQKEVKEILQSPQNLTSLHRYRWAEIIARQVLEKRPGPRSASRSDQLDKILTHKFFGLLIFIGLMYLVFQSIYTLAVPLMNGIEMGVNVIGEWARKGLSPFPVLESLVVDGILAGVSSALIFLPQIVILFFFIAILEGSGYLARAAFLMDRLLSWCGLNGRAFVPLLSSFACAIPGVMATRVIPDHKTRLATILVAPLMSCSARLPVYLLVIGAIIEPNYGPVWAGVALFGMHFLGLLVAIPVSLLLTRGLSRRKSLPVVLELPPYQPPKMRDVFLTMYLRAKAFLRVAGTIIVTLSIVLWALLYFPRSPEDFDRYHQEYQSLPLAVKEKIKEENYIQSRQVENSYLGRFGHSIEPLFRPAGFDWRLSTAILSAFPAREVVVPSLGIMFSIGGDVDESSGDLRQAIAHATLPDGRPLMTPYTAAGFMVFFALCCQCMGTLAVVRRETGSWRWSLFLFSYMTALAYIGAVLVHQVGRLLGN
jgi:ferrous iron transport protein B